MSNPEQSFGKIRAFFWPIHNYELKKFLPLLLMFFFITFNYSILRNAKDALLVTAPGSGAEAIPFLKFWGVIPSAVLFMLVYAKLSNMLSKPGLFYVTITPFILFFILFSCFLYPMKEILHPSLVADKLQAKLPIGLSGLIAIFRNWTYALFYIMSELWGSVVLSLLFWGFCNDITKIGESKRFYALFGLGANLALVVSGPITQFIARLPNYITPTKDSWQMTIDILMILASVSGLIVIFLYHWINKRVLTDARFYDTSELKKVTTEKPKMSLWDSFAFLARSKYILCIAILVVAYGIAINLIEVTWKSQLKLQYPNASDYLHFMGHYTTYMGITTVVMILFISSNVMRRFGWGVAAQITPIVLLFTGIGFFSFVIFKDKLTPTLVALHTTPLMVAVLFGTVQNIMSKASKYSLFDPTKEMAYIPLDQESKVKGKAAIDVVGSRLGKAGGSLIQQILIGTFGSIAAVTPHIAVILFVIILAWIFATHTLNKSLTALNNN